MSDLDSGRPSPLDPLEVELARMKRSTLAPVIGDVDQIIDLLTSVQQKVAQDSHSIGMAMTTLQNPVKARLESINSSLKEVTKAQKSFGKTLDKAMPLRELPMEANAMENQLHLINRAITMHLLREGQFSVASTFLRESRANLLLNPHKDADGDDEMKKIEGNNVGPPGDIQSQDLKDKFSEMYRVLSHLRNRILIPAIEWARENSSQLEAKGSSLEFELSKLQFIWLFKGPAVNGLPDDERNGQQGALQYAREHFARFQSRHLKEIQQLCCAMVFTKNLESSPYRKLFEIDSAFEDVSMSFTREFCSLLGLSAESPLSVAVMAGSIALPRLIKYSTYMKEKKTEWTSENEMAFETPLPSSMIYHSIFVCPVSKEQATDQNPPMMLTCGHAICQESLYNLSKGSRYKCPYCPNEGNIRDAMKISF